MPDTFNNTRYLVQTQLSFVAPYRCRTPLHICMGMQTYEVIATAPYNLQRSDMTKLHSILLYTCTNYACYKLTIRPALLDLYLLVLELVCLDRSLLLGHTHQSREDQGWSAAACSAEGRLQAWQT